MGWKVHVGCFELGQPLRELFDAFEVGWIDLNKSAIDLDSEVGLLWGTTSRPSIDCSSIMACGPDGSSIRPCLPSNRWKPLPCTSSG